MLPKSGDALEQHATVVSVNTIVFQLARSKPKAYAGIPKGSLQVSTCHHLTSFGKVQGYYLPSHSPNRQTVAVPVVHYGAIPVGTSTKQQVLPAEMEYV
jgi:hypothetical protein